MTTKAERGAWVLAEYAGRYYPGAEDTEDQGGAFTVASDITADLMHVLDSLGHEDPESIATLASVHYSEEREEECIHATMVENPVTKLMYCERCGYPEVPRRA